MKIKVMLVLLITIFLTGCSDCLHERKVIRKSYAPPPPTEVKYFHNNNSSTPTIEKYLFGVTEIVEECSLCNARWYSNMLGKIDEK